MTKMQENFSKVSRNNLPNILSLSRIFLTIPIVVCIYTGTDFSNIIAMLLVLVAAATDVLDGLIARRMKLVTDVGKFLDPLSDKILICSIFITMIETIHIPFWAVILIIVRELAVTSLRSMAVQKVVLEAKWAGKWKTALQLICILLLLSKFKIYGLYLFYLVVILTLLSGAMYFISYFKKHDKNP